MSIIFKSTRGNGGYGDRLVGLISTLFISKALNRDFYIHWCDELYYLDVKNKPSDDILEKCHEINLIDERAFNMINDFESKKIEEIWNYEFLMINCNQNIVQLLYVNPNYSDIFKIENYEKDIKNAYDDIYTKYLIPTQKLNNYIFNIINNKNLSLGIHIRTGDIRMNVGNFNPYNSDSQIEDVVKSICNNIPKFDDYIFITSDYDHVYDFFCKYLDKNKIIYNNDKIIHIDMCSKNDIENGILKLLSDHIILSKCNSVIFQTYTNFGRTAALICNGKRYCIGTSSNFIDIKTISFISSKSIKIPKKIENFFNKK